MTDSSAADDRSADAFARTMVGHGPGLLRAARAVLGDVHLAEDAVARTYLKA